jgi:hypothetical protein
LTPPRSKIRFVYRLAPPDGISSDWHYSILHRFKGGRHGASPIGRLAIDGAGNVYGATREGGGACAFTGGCGVIFKLSPPVAPQTAWTHNILHRFQAGQPRGDLLLKGNNLYGVTGFSVYRLTL